MTINSAKIREAMEAKQMNISLLSKIMNVTYVTAHKLVRGGPQEGIRFKTLEALCAVLDLEPNDIIERRPDDRNEVEAGRCCADQS